MSDLEVRLDKIKILQLISSKKKILSLQKIKKRIMFF